MLGIPALNFSQSLTVNRGYSILSPFRIGSSLIAPQQVPCLPEYTLTPWPWSTLLIVLDQNIQCERCHLRRKKKRNQSHWLVEWVLILKWALSAYQTLGSFHYQLFSGIFFSFSRKSTFFNILTKSSVPAENFPFCTINPNESQFTVVDWPSCITHSALRSSTSTGSTVRFLVPVLWTAEVKREASSFEISSRFLFSKQPAFLNVNERS